jgi:hypothetical protein
MTIISFSRKMAKIYLDFKITILPGGWAIVADDTARR